MKQHDVIVVGGGHNGLTAAAYLAKAGLDVLVLDALQPKPHATHFSVDQAVEAARRIGAGRTLFTHIAHSLPHRATNRKLPASMRLAYDGQRVTARLS